MIYSPRVHPEVNESHINKVSELWSKTMVNNAHVFNLSNCSVVFKM